MAVTENTITSAKVCRALDIDFVNSFTEEFNRLFELLGMFPIETAPAGAAINQYTVTGTMGSAPAEGDVTPLSLLTVDKTPIGDMAPERYAKMTTAEAILKGGFENAVIKTDRRMRSNMRSAIWGKFFTGLAAGTGTATGTNLQNALAFGSAAVSKNLEDNGDDTEKVVSFVNLEDVAAYLGSANIVTQNAFGVNYLRDFLGLGDVIATSKVTKGTVYSTPIENIHIYGLDFASLNEAGLEYETDTNGLIGIHHKPDYDRGSATTFAMLGMKMVPEVKNYIVKTTISA